MNTLKQARLNAGLTQAKMSKLLEIPKRTIENWENDLRKCPAYVERLVIAELSRIKEQSEKNGL